MRSAPIGSRYLGVVCGVMLMVAGAALPAWAQEGELTVRPSEGPVGTQVTIEGTGCNNPGQPTNLVFIGGNEGATGTDGSQQEGISRIPTDEDRHFSVTYTIPSHLHGYPAEGGGPVVPGRYVIRSLPPYCKTFFTVTAGPGELPMTGRPVPWTAAALVGLLLAVLRRGRGR